MKEAENITEVPSQALPSEDKTPESLKPEPKISKKFVKKKFLKGKKAKSTPQGLDQGIVEEKSNSMGTQPCNSNEREDGKHVESRDESEPKNITKEKQVSGIQQSKRMKARVIRKGKKQQNQKNKTRLGGSIRISENQISKREHDSYGREAGKEVESMHENELQNITNEKQVSRGLQNKRRKAKLSGLEWEQPEKKIKRKFGELQKIPENHIHRRQHSNKPGETSKGNLGGLIFMCNAKTKPDCFRYCVMGVPLSKKDLVLSVKPGLLLFLYDYDLKLMYGIYKASSAGGMKLEPAAFQGAFPAQVRFSVHKDCYPLPESAFKKAMEENYNERQKFKTELTFEQVKKLKRLFQKAEIRSNASAFRSSPRVIQDRELHEQARESLPRSLREADASDGYGDGRTRSYTGLSLERDRRIAYRAVASVGSEDFPRDSFLTEKDYRTHGLRRETQHLTPPTYAPPAEGEHILRHQAPIAHREPGHHDPHFPTENEYRLYGVGARRELAPFANTSTTLSSYPLDPYYNYDRREVPSTASSAATTIRKDPYYSQEYGASLANLYTRPPTRGEVASGSYSLGGRGEIQPSETSDSRRREIDETERYSRYASDALSEYNQRHHLPGSRPETAFVPVSSRYSFAGPSSYR